MKTALILLITIAFVAALGAAATPTLEKQIIEELRHKLAVAEKQRDDYKAQLDEIEASKISSRIAKLFASF